MKQRVFIQPFVRWGQTQAIVSGGRTLGRGTIGRGTLGRRRQTRVDSRSGDPHRVDSRSGASLCDVIRAHDVILQRALM